MQTLNSEVSQSDATGFRSAFLNATSKAEASSKEEKHAPARKDDKQAGVAASKEPTSTPAWTPTSAPIAQSSWSVPGSEIGIGNQSSGATGDDPTKASDAGSDSSRNVSSIATQDSASGTAASGSAGVAQSIPSVRPAGMATPSIDPLLGIADDSDHSVDAGHPAQTSEDVQATAVTQTGSTNPQTGTPQAINSLLPVTPFAVSPLGGVTGTTPLQGVGGLTGKTQASPGNTVKSSDVTKPASPQGREKTKDAGTQTDAPAASLAPVAAAAQSQSGSGQGHAADSFAQQLDQSKAVSQHTASAAPANFSREASIAQAAAPAPQATVASAPDPVALPSLSDARLVQSVRQSEMKLGMNSVEFGAISIRTSVTQSVLSTQISVSHAELSTALLAHVPAMQEKLNTSYGLQTKVEILSNPSSSQQDSGSQGGSNRQGSNNAGARTSVPVMLSAQSSRPLITSQPSPTVQDSRLDVRI